MAEIFRTTPHYLYAIIGCRAIVSLQMCHRLAIVFGEDAEMWATRQLQYDLDTTAGGKREINPNFSVEDIPRVHPGSLLREQFMNPNNVTNEIMAAVINKEERSVSYILAGKQELDLKSCLEMERLFGENAEYWATLQMRYDLDRTRAEVEAEGFQPWKPSKGPK